MTTSAELQEVESCVVAHGLPYFVVDIREQVLARLNRPRLVAVLTVAVFVGVAAGIVVGSLSAASFGVSTAFSVALGLIVLIRGMTIEGPPPNRTYWRPLLWILGSVVLFGLLVQPAGIVIATLTLVLVCAFGGHEFHWKEQVIEAVILAIAVVAIFSYGLGLPFKLFPWSF